MPNLGPEAAWTYHNATKHSYRSIRDHAHFLDWANQPVPFKVYPALELLPLPREVRPTGVPALSAIAETTHPNHIVPDLSAVSQLLRSATRPQLEQKADPIAQACRSGGQRN